MKIGQFKMILNKTSLLNELILSVKSIVEFGIDKNLVRYDCACNVHKVAFRKRDKERVVK